jgi:hypothetical protein
VVMAQPEVQARRSGRQAARVECCYPENLAREQPVPLAILQEHSAEPMQATVASYP